MLFTLTVHGKPVYFDVTVGCPLQVSLLCRSAVSEGVAAAKEEDKDAHHDELAGCWRCLCPPDG